MNKVKIFYEEYPRDLQERIDLWIENNEPNVISVSSVTQSNFGYMVSILYNESIMLNS
jgi:hypothetical protein